MFAAMWLAAHEERVEQWKDYVLICVNILVLDAVVKDIWYGSLKKGCKCTCNHQPSTPLHEARSLVV